MEASKDNTSNIANRYTIISKLGSGLSSKVFKVFDEKTQESKVAKIYEDNASLIFQKETKIFKALSELDIPTNIKFYESSFDYISHKFIFFYFFDSRSLFRIICNHF